MIKLRGAARAMLGAFAVLLISGCGLSDQENRQKVQDNLTEAYQQAQNGNTGEARRWADRAIALRPGDVAVYASRPPEDSPFDTGAATDTAPQFSVADVFLATHDNVTLASYMKQAQSKFPQSDWPLAPLEQAQGLLGDKAAQHATAARLASLLEAKIGKPRTIPSAALLNRLAQACFDAGNTAKGEAKYRQVITTFPFDPHAYDAMNGLAYNIAIANDKAHFPEAFTLAAKALAQAQKLVREHHMVDGEAGAVQDTLGWVEYRQGQYQAALNDLQQAMNADPREPENRYHLAMTYKAMGNMEAARAELRHAVLISPDYAEAARELATLPPPVPDAT